MFFDCFLVIWMSISSGSSTLSEDRHDPLWDNLFADYDDAEADSEDSEVSKMIESFLIHV